MTGVETEGLAAAPLAVVVQGSAPLAVTCVKMAQFALVCEEATPSAEVCVEPTTYVPACDEASPFTDEEVAPFAALLCVDAVDVEDVDVVKAEVEVGMVLDGLILTQWQLFNSPNRTVPYQG